MEEFHPLVRTIVNLLQEKSMWFEAFQHQEVKTSEEAAHVREGYSLSQGAKALIVRIKKEGKETFVQLVIPGSARIDSKKVKEFLKTKDLRFATPEEITSLTNGVQIGGIPPFGNLFNLSVYVDPSVVAHGKIVFNAGDRRFSIGMFAKDYLTLVQPQVVQLV